MRSHCVFEDQEFEKTREWMIRFARPLDLARWNYHFEGKDKGSVLSCLEQFQNEDGGFGHGLEPDCWNPMSSPIQTWTALGILDEIDVAVHPMIERIKKYLMSGKDFRDGRWMAIIPSNNNHPRAPWWSFSEESLNQWGYNPTASIAGYLIKHSDASSNEQRFGIKIASEAIDSFMHLEGPFDMHLLRCHSELAKNLFEKNIKDISMKTYVEKLIHSMVESIEQDESLWKTTYCAKPSQYITSKESIGYKEMHHLVTKEVEFIKNARCDDGVWDIPWRWGMFDVEFEIAKTWWKGSLAISNMLFLKSFDIK